MSNNAPDYENNLAFDPDINTMPRCDIEELKGQIEQLEALNTADDFLIKLLQEKNQQLKELLKECSEFLYEILTGTHSKLSFKLESGIRKQYYMISLSELKTKIDNAIGENN